MINNLDICVTRTDDINSICAKKKCCHETQTDIVAAAHKGSSCIRRTEETFGNCRNTGKHCQFNPLSWQNSAVRDQNIPVFVSLLKCTMSRDSLMPYVTGWIGTKVLKPIKGSAV